MLEIKNVKRIYKPKKGVPVTALDDISLKFADTGIVFLLGKSGSGKSTLLNVMGGLDKYDEGEIIIKGKSSKEFTQGDFDSYRNTYLGFIFQEYNILNEFTVGANIALALELQGKKATDDAVNTILEEVDLVGYGSRKPSELSGGQKQRVAIARALVKNPEIIMADEPTGSLDSVTGLQVFDTLKKLSKHKLVLVVTHDREFAELYGDRVIELKDGKVISDIEKFKAESHKKNDSISVIDDKIIQIKKGYKLTQKDLDFINEYILEQDAILSIDKKTNDDMKKFARIDIDGNREAFKETDESAIISAEDKKFKLIKSKLPFKNSFKIGASSLKNKPFRLAITILLSIVAFCMFGLADTMGSYNKYITTKRSIEDSQVNNYTLQKTKNFYHKERDYTSSVDIHSSDSDIAMLKNKIGLDFDKVYKPERTDLSFRHTVSAAPYGISMYTFNFGGYIEANSEKMNSLGFKYKGVLPINNNQIAVSQYVYSHYAKFGYTYIHTVIVADDITSEEYFLSLNPKIEINQNIYEITAIVETEFDYKHFESLSDEKSNMIMRSMLGEELEDTVIYGYHGLIFVADGFIAKQLESKVDKPLGYDVNNGSFSIANERRTSTTQNNRILMDANILYNIKDFNKLELESYIKDDKKTLAKNEFMINGKTYLSMLSSRLFDIAGRDYEKAKMVYKQNAPNWYYEYSYGFVDFYGYIYNHINSFLEVDENYFNLLLLERGNNQEEVNQMRIEDKREQTYFYINDNKTSTKYCKSYNQLMDEHYAKYGNSDETLYKELVLKNAISSGEIMDTNGILPEKYFLNAYSNITQYQDQKSEMTLVGLIIDFYSNEGKRSFVVDDTLYDNMYVEDLGDYAFLIAKMPIDSATLTKVIKFGYDNNDKDTIFRMKNGVMSTMDLINDLIEMLASTFLYIGLGFALFATIMLMNYISTSISYKRREIGILRAVGARSSDVFGIFLNESLLIALINFVLAVVATFVTVLFINNTIRTEYNQLITVLNFGIRQIFLMLAISITVAVVASFLPVYKVARQLPVDAIKK